MPPTGVLRATSLASLPVDEEERLAAQLLLLRGDSRHHSDAVRLMREHLGVQAVLLEGALADALLPSTDAAEGIPAAPGPSLGCLERGLPLGLATAATVEAPKPGDVVSDAAISRWIRTTCESVEVGLINYLHVGVRVMWAAPDGAWKQQALLRPRCKVSITGHGCISWQNTFLGHSFELRPEDPAASAPVSFTVQHAGVVSIGEPAPLPEELYRHNWTAVVETTQALERKRARAVHRTFTEVGFARAPIPERTWAALSTYYYNNRHAAQREDWDDLGTSMAFVNWWESQTRLIPMPLRWKERWHRELMPTVAAWAGDVQLQATAFYGMRVYADASWLIRHVDREDTHALSAIMNLDQSDDVEAWPLLIDSLDGETHSLTISPGEMLFYESARCLHGRPLPLKGSRFVNAFVHYRPKDDPHWHAVAGSYSGAAVRWAADHIAVRSEEAREMARRLAAHSGHAWLAGAAAASPSAAPTSSAGSLGGSLTWEAAVALDAAIAILLFGVLCLVARRLRLTGLILARLQRAARPRREKGEAV